jgi:uncharacterized phage infection (PIP) family protein YhgE
VLSLRTRLRAYLGTDLLPLLESQMTTMLELLTGLTNQTAEASAAQQASFLNLHNGMNRLAQQVTDLRQQLADAAANSGQVTEEMQVKANEISESLADMKKAADTADNGFEPVEEPVITDPGTEVPANPEVPVETTPAEETLTVPVEGQPVTDEGTTSRRRS